MLECCNHQNTPSITYVIVFSENLYKSMADVMASEGYLEAGYNLVNIDDCWMANKRDFDGTLQANYSRFPNGIKALADYVSSFHLKRVCC